MIQKLWTSGTCTIRTCLSTQVVRQFDEPRDMVFSIRISDVFYCILFVFSIVFACILFVFVLVSGKQHGIVDSC